VIAGALAATAFAPSAPAPTSSSQATADAARPATAATVDSLLDRGEFPQAERVARAVLADAERDHGPDSAQTGAALDALLQALAQLEKGADAQSQALAARALALKQRLYGPDHDELAITLTRAGRLQQQAGEVAAAQAGWERALHIRERTRGPESLEVARLLSNLGALKLAADDYAGARADMERALALKEKLLGPQHQSVAATLINLALLLSDLGEWDTARQDMERGLRIEEQLMGPDHPDVAADRGNLGWILMQEGQDEEAQANFERALAVQERRLGPQSAAVASTLTNLAIVLGKRGDLTRARSIDERVLALREKLQGPLHRDTAVAATNLGAVLSRIGDYEAARRMYDRSIQIIEQSEGPEHTDLATNLLNRGTDRLALGDLPGARSDLERSLALFTKSLGPEHRTLEFALAPLGDCAMLQGDPQAARAFYERALQIAREAGSREKASEAGPLRGLAAVLLAQGRAADAEPLLQQALAAVREGLSPTHPASARALLSLADVYARTGRPEAAVDAAIAAEQIAREHLRLVVRGLPEPELLACVRARASGFDAIATLAASDPKLPPAVVQRAWDAVVRSRALGLDELATRHVQMQMLDDPQSRTLAATYADASARLANLLVRAPQAGNEHYRSAVEHTRAEQESAELAMLWRSAPLRARSQRQQIGLAEVVAALPPDAALVAYTLYEPRMVSSSTGLGAAWGATVPLGARGAPSYVAFVLSAKGAAPVAVPLGAAAAIDSLVGAWRAVAGLPPKAAGGSAPAGPGQDAEAACRAAGLALAERVWTPVAARLRPAGTVFVVPDGELHLVNLAALADSSGTFLVESGPLLHVLSAERDLVPVSEPAPATSGMLALGDPDFDAPLTVEAPRAPAQHGAEPALLASASFRGAAPPCATFASLRWGRLRQSGREVDDVLHLWRAAARKHARSIEATRRGAGRREQEPAVRLTRAAATEAAFKREAPRYRMLHVATHAFFVAGSCAIASPGQRGIGGLVVESAPGADAGSPAQISEGDTPASALQLAGLVLAGANHLGDAPADGEDGVLSVEEAAVLDLRGVEWAVFSACNTGVGATRAGEGVFGFRRAFQVAGARTLILSLWPVEDAATRRWMRALYEARLEGGLSTAEAVRAASLRILQERRHDGDSTHPFYWAGFLASGDWR
jgi:CHAT domain-containing protein/tetratricopeptide (TPR) repeat protein